MNSEPQTPNPQTPANSPEPPSPFAYRGNGKVARLPKPIRDQINHWLLDGLSYPAIIQRLGQDAQDLTPDNLSEWKKRGYQAWLKEQFWRDEMRARQEAFTGVLAGADPIQLPEAGLQLAALGLCELLRELAQPAADAKPDPDKYIRVANSLARLTSSILQIQQYRDASAKAQHATQPLQDPHPQPTAESERAQEHQKTANADLKAEHDPDTQPPLRQSAISHEPAVGQLSTFNSQLSTNEQPSTLNSQLRLAAPCEPVPVCNSSSSEEGPARHSSTDVGPVRHSFSDGGNLHHQPAGASENPQPLCTPNSPSAINHELAVEQLSTLNSQPSTNEQPSTLNPQLHLVPLVPEFPPGVCCNCYRRKLLKFGQPFPYECHRCSVYEEPRRWFWEPKLVEVPELPSPAPTATASPAPPASCAELAPG